MKEDWYVFEGWAPLIGVVARMTCVYQLHLNVSENIGPLLIFAVLRRLKEDRKEKEYKERMRIANSFDKEVSTLETMPERYGYVKDEHLASLGFRMTMTGKYLLFYIVDHTAKTVTVIRVLHGRRDWISILTSCSNKQEQGGINC